MDRKNLSERKIPLFFVLNCLDDLLVRAYFLDVILHLGNVTMKIERDEYLLFHRSCLSFLCRP